MVLARVYEEESEASVLIVTRGIQTLRPSGYIFKTKIIKTSRTCRKLRNSIAKKKSNCDKLNRYENKIK